MKLISLANYVHIIILFSLCMIKRARRGAEVSHGGGGKINQTSKSMDAVRMAEEKLSLGGFNSVKENKKQSKEKVDDGITVNTETSG